MNPIDKMFLLVATTGIVANGYIDFFYRYISENCMKRGGCEIADSPHCIHWNSEMCDRNAFGVIYFITVNYLYFRSSVFIYNYTEIEIVTAEVIEENSNGSRLSDSSSVETL